MAFFQKQGLRDLPGPVFPVVGGLGMQPVTDHGVILSEPAEPLAGGVDQFPRSPRPTALMSALLMVVTRPG